MKVYTDLHIRKNEYKNKIPGRMARKSVTVIEFDSGCKLTKCIYSDLWFLGRVSKDPHLTGRLLTVEEAMVKISESDTQDAIFNLDLLTGV